MTFFGEGEGYDEKLTRRLGKTLLASREGWDIVCAVSIVYHACLLNGGVMYAVVARCPLATGNKLAGRSSISLCRRVGCRRQYHSRLSTPSPKLDLVPTRGRIKSGRVQWCVYNWRSGRNVIGPTPQLTPLTRTINHLPRHFFLLASSPRPTNPVENCFHGQPLRPLASCKIQKIAVPIGQGRGLVR